MSSNPLFLESEFAQRPPEDALFQIVPVPFEHTVSYGGGTARGPGAILAASNQLEVFDGSSSPGEEGFHTWPSVDCDGGPGTVFPRIEDAVAAAAEHGVPVILGGEHSITAPAVRGVLREHPAPLGIIQIDAHADLRDEYEERRDSHACVARRLHGDLRLPLVQIGVRAISPEEVVYRATVATDPAAPPIVAHDAAAIVPPGTTAVDIPDRIPEAVYLTVDVDGLDPAVVPATGTPVPGGLGWYQFLGIVESIAARRRIVGFDVVELAPIDRLPASDYAAAEIAHRLMGIVARSRKR